MFLDFGWSEILLIGVVALVVIGPKDLPKAMRVAGYWMRKARALSQEFHNSVDEVIREAELEEVRQQLKKATEIDLEKQFERQIDPTGSLAEGLKPPELPDFSPPPATLAAEEPEIEPGHADAAIAPEPLSKGRPHTGAVDPEPDPAAAKL
ncbi:MAG TPA: Sec-independent protein translocase protein TatB [Stellaceae bacterium]|nr:Sec-independent protein translocase protein TatB [Stellaceae bacterium]